MRTPLYPPLNYKSEALDGFGIKRGNPPARTSGPSSVVTLGAVTPELPSVIGSEAFQREGNGAGRGVQEGFAAGGATSRHRKEHEPFHPHPNHSIPQGKSKKKKSYFSGISVPQLHRQKHENLQAPGDALFLSFPSFPAFWAVSKQFGSQPHNKKRGGQELLPGALQLLLITPALASISPTALLKG